VIDEPSQAHYTEFMRIKKAESGQALLLVLMGVVTVVVLTLSVVGRSVTDISVTTQDRESVRAFSAAEAGVEEALIESVVGSASAPVVIENTGLGEDGRASFKTSIAGFPVNPREYLVPSEISSGDIATVWLVGHDDQGVLTCATGDCFIGNRLDVCWGKEGTGPGSADTPAVSVTVFYDSGSVSTSRIAVDPNPSRTGENSFSSPSGDSCVVDGQTLAFSHSLDLGGLGVPVRTGGSSVGGPVAVVAQFHYNSSPHPIGFRSGSDFPAQGRRIDSVGSSGEATRRVEVFNIFPQLPSMFTSAIFSTVDLSK